MKVAVVGATGMVGRVLTRLLAERGFPVSEFIPVASERSAGTSISFQGKSHTVCTLSEAVEQAPDLALFSAGGATSLEWAPRFAAVGCRVVDNSSAWRMHENHRLVVPEINATSLSEEDYIIANPNCSTIQLVMTLSPLHRKYGLKRIIISTYQSVTGTGKKAVEQLEAERAGERVDPVYPYPIDRNCLPHCDVFLENGYTKEEMKLVNETRKILVLPELPVTATAVRVPVVGGHSESVNVEFASDFELGDVRKLLHESPGLVLQDNPDVNRYPMPVYASGRDEVFVGRLRRDDSQANTLNLWIVADNLRKGAATNALQIAEYLLEQGWLPRVSEG